MRINPPKDDDSQDMQDAPRIGPRSPLCAGVHGLFHTAPRTSVLPILGCFLLTQKSGPKRFSSASTSHMTCVFASPW